MYGYDGFNQSKQKLDEHRESSRGKLSYHDSSNRIISVSVKDKETGITYSTDARLAILNTTRSYMPKKQDVAIFEYLYSIGVIARALKKLSGVIAVDIETKGTQAADPDTRIVGIGIADAQNILYIDFETNGKEVNQFVLNFLSEYTGGLVAHNAFFDGAFLQRECGKWLDWKYDTYALYKQIETGGFPGQKWGLKDAQLQLLNWDHKGDVQLDEWLVRNGHVADIKKDEKEGYVFVEDYVSEAGEHKGPRWCKPRKSEMWRAPAQILGYYCGLDAASTWQLLHEVILPSIKGQAWEDIFWFYNHVFLENVRLHVDQQLHGITIDKPMLEAYYERLQERISHHYTEFVNHPDVRPFADERNAKILAECDSSEPAKYKKMKWPKEPKKIKKNGEISQVWLTWEQKTKELEEKGPDLSMNWVNWKEKRDKLASEEHLNLNSSQQMQWLFYEKLEYPILIRTYQGGTLEPEEYIFDFKAKEYKPNPELKKWLKTSPSTGVKALPGFGEAGKLLGRQKDEEKELTYVRACLEHLIQDEEGNWRLHPQFRMPGTLTCRLAGSGGLNLQQIPKSREYLECWKPKPGKVWIDCDHTSLEQVVLAELSRDPALMKVYGPDAPPHQDIYLFNGAQLPGLGEKILAAGYHPDYPTEEWVAKVKKECKHERGISKVITLGSSYGMGKKKLRMTLKMEGIEISKDEATALYDAYWKLYAGIKEYEKELKHEWKTNNGWMLNGIGRPVALPEGDKFEKDIINRVIQSTGHDIHMLYIYICDQLFREAGIEVRGIVWDFHDQSIIECDEQDKEIVYEIMGTKAYQVLNDKYLKGAIRLKGDPQYIRSMACAKCE